MTHEVKGLVYKTYSTGREVVDWGKNTRFTVDGYTINIIKNEMVEKIAKKSGKTRKERRLTLQLNGFQETYECGTESVKKGSFLKNLLKRSITEVVKEEVKEVKPVEEIKLFTPEELNEFNEIDFIDEEADNFDLITDEYGLFDIIKKPVEVKKPTLEDMLNDYNDQRQERNRRSKGKSKKCRA